MKSKILILLISALAAFALPALAANTATITFPASTTYSDDTPYPAGSVVTYNLWQGVKGAPKVKIGAFSSGGSITTGLLTGQEYCWDVTTVVKVTSTGPTLESPHSVEGCKNFVGSPGVVVITVT